MKIVRNDALVKRNRRIAQAFVIGGLLILLGSAYLSFRYPELGSWVFILFIVGFIVSQIGIYFSNRWSRVPRPDDALNQALKGLDDRHTLYHWSSPVSHLLVGPSGVWVLLPYRQSGRITYHKGRWRQEIKGMASRLMNGYLQIFAQEGLGRPDLEVTAELENMQRFMQKKLDANTTPPVRAALVFTHPNATIDVPEEEEPPAVTVPVGRLKDAVRKNAKQFPISPEQIKSLQEALGE